MDKTVEFTVRNGLCSSCGLCAAACPRSCIRYERNGGCFTPVVDKTLCTNCGICARICPGAGVDYPDGMTPSKAMMGECLACYTAWSRDPRLRHVSASGGVVTSLVYELLRKQVYDLAFCVDSYHYETQLKTVRVDLECLEGRWDENTTPKSRYLPVSHDDALRFVLGNRDKRVILIASPCAVVGWRRAIDQFHLDEDRYLLVGLFCDSVMNYNAYDYYQDRFSEGKQISGIHFKNKDSGGWPGDMKLLFSDGGSRFLPKEERAKIKDYFMPERCLYCIDKLNVRADISVGDNYTDENSSPLGSNSVVIRTASGEAAWNAARDALFFEPCDVEKLRGAQSLDWRENRYYYSLLKERQIRKEKNARVVINRGVRSESDYRGFEYSWKRSLARIRSGARYREDPGELDHQFELSKKMQNPHDPRVIARKLFYAVKKRL